MVTVNTGANARQLEDLVRDAVELRELAFILQKAQTKLIHIRRRLRSKVYPIPEYAKFANQVVDLFAALPDIPVTRALGASYGGLDGLQKIQLARGMPHKAVFAQSANQHRKPRRGF
jgi:hypothetical protein